MTACGGTVRCGQQDESTTFADNSLSTSACTVKQDMHVPVTSAVVVAIAGVIFPAIPLAVWRSASGIL